jgi:hypothetical protein
MKTLHIAVLALTLGIAPGATALAQSVGAPTSAAGGLSSEPLSSGGLPSAVGPLGGSSTTGRSVRDLTPGTGKFEPSTGQFELGTGKFQTHSTPCVGTTGFGSSQVQPGLKC